MEKQINLIIGKPKLLHVCVHVDRLSQNRLHKCDWFIVFSCLAAVIWLDFSKFLGIRFSVIVVDFSNLHDSKKSSKLTFFIGAAKKVTSLSTNPSSTFYPSFVRSKLSLIASFFGELKSLGGGEISYIILGSWHTTSLFEDLHRGHPPRDC